MADDWDKPLAPGLVRAPQSPRLELEPVVDDSPAYAEPVSADVEELRAQIKILQEDNKLLMKQIEDAWKVIRSRDETISYLSAR